MSPISDGTKSRDLKIDPLLAAIVPIPATKTQSAGLTVPLRTVYPTNHSVRDPMNSSICMSLILVDKIKQKIPP